MGIFTRSANMEPSPQRVKLWIFLSGIMRSYIVQKVTGSPQWDKISKADIDTVLWRDCPEGLRAWAQLCYDDDFLKARLSAVEEEPLARFEGLLNMVHLDSCLEFFFRPGENEGPYFNF